MSDEGQPPEVVVEALGVAVGIPASGSTAARLRRQWSRALTDRVASVVVDAVRPADADGDGNGNGDVVAHDYALTSRVTMAALDATAGRRINLHAGAVADEQGRALAVIGPSGSGKTTAVSFLARRLGYLSDETVSLDEDLLVHAHPKPLSVITDPGAPHLKSSLSPDDLGLLHPPERAHLHRIVLLHRGAGDAGLVPVPAPRAIAAMVEQSSSLALLDHPVHRLAALVDACGGVWGLEYVDFGNRVDEVVGLLDAEPRATAEHVHHPYDGSADGEPPHGAWSRAAWKDAEAYDDQVVVMVGDRVHVLAGLGVVVWLELESPRTVDALVSRAEALWGAHPESARLVADALELLTTEGLLRPPA